MKALFIVFFVFLLFAIPVFGQEMELYQNGYYSFSFNMPTGWVFEEDVIHPDGTIIQVLLYPEEFNRFLDFDTPLITVVFENIPKSEVTSLNSQSLKDYALDQIRIEIPNGRIYNSKVETKSWGWEITTWTDYTRDFGTGTPQSVRQKDMWFVFKDRESYNVSFTGVGNYGTYIPVFIDIIETLEIKFIKVSEPTSSKISEPESSTLSTDDIIFNTYTNSDYGFSIKYPQNMEIYDEVFEWPAEAGYDDGGASIVFFSENRFDWYTNISVSLSKNNNDAQIYEGQDYLNTLKMSEEEYCEFRTEYRKCNFSMIDSKIFTINGRKAYQVMFEYDLVDDRGSGMHNIVVSTDIVDGNNVWTISSSSNPTKYPELATIIEETINSFSIEGDDTQQLSIASAEETSQEGGGCLIATATFGSELAPQVQQLREIRDNSLLQTESGSAFMKSFNQFYYSFSPVMADLERENPVFKEAVKLTITPLLASLSLLNYVDLDSEESVLGYGVGIIMMNVGMYFVAPVIIIHRIRKYV